MLTLPPSFQRFHFALAMALALSLLAGALPHVRGSAAWMATEIPAVLPTAAAGPAIVADVDQARAADAQLGISFEENRGQVDGQVKFLSRSGGATVFLTADAAWFVLSAPPQSGAGGDGEVGAGEAGAEGSVRLSNARRRENDAATDEGRMLYAVRMKIEGANPQASVTGEHELAGRINYFRGNDPAHWQTNVPTFGGVRYEGIYAGIDLVYYGNAARELEYDFRVGPGANAGQVSLRFAGAESLSVDAATGDLLIKTPAGDLRQHKPVVYQEADGERREIVSGYAIEQDERVRFTLGAYDASRELIIDPVLSYSTFLGGNPTFFGDNGDDGGGDIAVDAAGNTYIIGRTNSTSFPTTPGAFDTTLSGSRDAFVTKLNADGSTLLYSTYLGGSGSDFGSDIVIDAAGNAYVTGNTFSTDFPTTPGAFDSTFNGSADAFVTKLNADGSALLYSTYLGGSGDGNVNSTFGDSGDGIKVDAAGNAYVTGSTNSANFPTTLGAFDTTLGGEVDAFVTKLNADGSALLYSTYLGGSAIGFLGDSGNGIAVDANGNAYVTGLTTSGDFPTTPGAFNFTRGGFEDAFVTKLNADGSALLYSTRLGGNNYDNSGGIAVDADGNAYVTGSTSSTDFPTTPGAFDRSGGFVDAFVTKLNADGSALLYSTYLSSADGDDITIDAAGNAYVTGSTNSINFPTTPGAFDTTHNGGRDAFMTKLNADGSTLLYSTYLGGNSMFPNGFRGQDYGIGIVIDTAGNAYVAGTTGSPNFPTTTGAFDTVLGERQDAFVSKLVFSSTPTPTPTPATVLAAGSTLVSESCPSANGAPDHGERVSVLLAVMNGGNASTPTLTGILNPSSNVIAPSATQNYGVIAPNTTVTRTYSFTASGTPGQQITLPLELRDANGYLVATLTYTLALGSDSACAVPRLLMTTTLPRFTVSTINTITMTVVVENQGVTIAASAMLTQAMLGSTSGTPIPQSLGNLAPGQSRTTFVTFSTEGNPPGATRLLRVRGRYDGNRTFGSTGNVTMPPRFELRPNENEELND